MDKYKFPCPICGQKILCDAEHAGAKIACPNCNNRISVPRGFYDAPAPPPAPAPPSAPPPLQPPPPSGPTSVLAIASLVCSLATIVTCIGWLPGIICGHLARAKIRQNPSLRGGGAAMIGLVIGYAGLLLSVGGIAAVYEYFGPAIAQQYRVVRSMMPASRTYQVQIAPASATNFVAADATNPPASFPPPPQAAWTLDLKDMQFPDNPAGGTIHGQDFSVKKVVFANGNLRILSESMGLVVVIQGLGAKLENVTREIQPSSTDDVPEITINWKADGKPGNAKFTGGYAMKLTVGKAAKRKIHGQIYLCLPDDEKSCIAGSFDIMTPKKKQ